MALRTYKLDFGWEIAVPDNWIMEKRELGSYFFYPEDPEDDTTLYASAIHSVTAGNEPTPERMMRESFEKTIPAGAQEVEIMTSVHCKAFFLLGADGVYRIGAGFFTNGELLSLNVYARGDEKAREAASGFSQIKFAGGRKNAF